MRSKELEEYKRTLKLSKKQRSIIIGTLLGDGHLETQNNGRTYRLKIEHSEKQSFYVDWLYSQFLDWCKTEPKIKEKVLGEVKVRNYAFQTLSVGQFRFYAKSFYDKYGKKRIPSNINKLLDPLSLGVWFMDDGSYKSKYHKAIILNTHCFSRQEILTLIQSLEQKFAIEARLRKQTDGLQIIIVGESAELFYKTVKPYVLPDFYYKFGVLVNILPKRYRRRSKVS